MDNLYKDLKNFGQVKANESLSKHTTFKVGGPVRFLVIVEDTDKLVEALKYLDGMGEKYIVIAGGSNMLFSDDGFDGVVVKIANREQKVEGDSMIFGAGVVLGQALTIAAQNGLSGLEWGVGVPGTVGGAVYGNAGAYGSDIGTVVEKVDVYRDGEIITLTKEECGFYYRGSDFKHHGGIVLRVYLKLKKGDKAEIMKTMQETIKIRVGKSPKGFSAGCFFKNIKLEDWEGDKSILPEKFLNYK